MTRNVTLNAHDLAHLARVWRDEVWPAVCDESYDGPTVESTSLGYVNVWSDGDVTSTLHGPLANVGDERPCAIVHADCCATLYRADLEIDRGAVDVVDVVRLDPDARDPVAVSEATFHAVRFAIMRD